MASDPGGAPASAKEPLSAPMTQAPRSRWRPWVVAIVGGLMALGLVTIAMRRDAETLRSMDPLRRVSAEEAAAVARITPLEASSGAVPDGDDSPIVTVGRDRVFVGARDVSPLPPREGPSPASDDPVDEREGVGPLFDELDALVTAVVEKRKAKDPPHTVTLGGIGTLVLGPQIATRLLLDRDTSPRTARIVVQVMMAAGMAPMRSVLVRTPAGYRALDTSFGRRMPDTATIRVDQEGFTLITAAGIVGAGCTARGEGPTVVRSDGARDVAEIVDCVHKRGHEINDERGEGTIVVSPGSFAGSLALSLRAVDALREKRPGAAAFSRIGFSVTGEGRLADTFTAWARYHPGHAPNDLVTRLMASQTAGQAPGGSASATPAPSPTPVARPAASHFSYIGPNAVYRGDFGDEARRAMRLLRGRTFPCWGYGDQRVEGSIGFSIAVSREGGTSATVQASGSTPPAVAECVRVALGAVVFGPAADGKAGQIDGRFTVRGENEAPSGAP